MQPENCLAIARVLKLMHLKQRVSNPIDVGGVASGGEEIHWFATRVKRVTTNESIYAAQTYKRSMRSRKAAPVHTALRTVVVEPLYLE